MYETIKKSYTSMELWKQIFLIHPTNILEISKIGISPRENGVTPN